MSSFHSLHFVWLKCLEVVQKLSFSCGIYNNCNILTITVLFKGSVATAEDPAAIATIQSAATFTDQPIKYLFKTEGAGGQVGRTDIW